MPLFADSRSTLFSPFVMNALRSTSIGATTVCPEDSSTTFASLPFTRKVSLSLPLAGLNHTQKCFENVDGGLPAVPHTVLVFIAQKEKAVPVELRAGRRLLHLRQRLTPAVPRP